jgi:hypothetical protein
LRWVNRGEVSLIESQQQRVLVHVQQMLVGSRQERNLCERSLGENLAVVLLRVRDQPQFNQAHCEPLGDGEFCSG